MPRWAIMPAPTTPMPSGSVEITIGMPPGSCVRCRLAIASRRERRLEVDARSRRAPTGPTPRGSRGRGSRGRRAAAAARPLRMQSTRCSTPTMWSGPPVGASGFDVDRAPCPASGRAPAAAGPTSSRLRAIVPRSPMSSSSAERVPCAVKFASTVASRAVTQVQRDGPGVVDVGPATVVPGERSVGHVEPVAGARAHRDDPAGGAEQPRDRVQRVHAEVDQRTRLRRRRKARGPIRSPSHGGTPPNPSPRTVWTVPDRIVLEHAGARARPAGTACTLGAATSTSPSLGRLVAQALRGSTEPANGFSEYTCCPARRALVVVASCAGDGGEVDDGVDRHLGAHPLLVGEPRHADARRLRRRPASSPRPHTATISRPVGDPMELGQVVAGRDVAGTQDRDADAPIGGPSRASPRRDAGDVRVDGAQRRPHQDRVGSRARRRRPGCRGWSAPRCVLRTTLRNRSR